MNTPQDQDNTLRDTSALQPEAAEQVDVPASALVHCPLVGFKLRQVAKCLECEHMQGRALVDRFPGAVQLAFAQRYTVPCTARPTLREIKETE